MRLFYNLSNSVMENPHTDCKLNSTLTFIHYPLYTS